VKTANLSLGTRLDFNDKTLLVGLTAIDFLFRQNTKENCKRKSPANGKRRRDVN
jgi:hypothetical protein